MFIDVIGKRKIFLGISLVAVAAAVVLMLIFGFKEGIDFRGGTLWRIKAENTDVNALNTFISGLGVNDAKISESGDNAYIVRMRPLSEDEHESLRSALGERLQKFEELSFESIGPSVGEALRKRAVTGIILVLVGISLYIAFAFRKVYRPVSSWKYGFVTLLSLAHDVIIPAGMLAVLGRYLNVEIDGNFVVALLVVMGFSVHDTIVVFDRIRENILLDKGRGEFGEIINASVNQTMARSINTSLTLILVLLALLFAGPTTLTYFILTLLVGVSVGIYSSIFVASPLLYEWHRLSTARRK